MQKEFLLIATFGIAFAVFIAYHYYSHKNYKISPIVSLTKITEPSLQTSPFEDRFLKLDNKAREYYFIPKIGSLGFVYAK